MGKLSTTRNRRGERARRRAWLIGLAAALLVAAGVAAFQRFGGPRDAPPGTVPSAAAPGAQAAGVDTASIRAHDEALALSRAGRTAEALERLDAAILDDPSYDQLYVSRGVIHRRLQQFDEAVADFSRAIELAPRAWQTYLYRGIVYTDDLDAHDLGIRDFRTVIALNPDNTDAVMNMGVAHYKAGRYEEAIARYSDAIARTRDSTRITYLRGLAYLANGDAAGARTDMSTAQRSGYPVDRVILDSLGVAPWGVGPSPATGRAPPGADGGR